MRGLQASGHSIWSIDPCVILSYVCFCWKTSYLIYITDLLTLNSQPVLLYLISEGSLSNTCISSATHSPAFLSLASPWHQAWGPCQTADSPTGNTNNAETRHYTGHRQDTCSHSRESWNKKVTSRPIWPQLGTSMQGNSHLFCFSEHVHQWLRKCRKYWFWDCK